MSKRSEIKDQTLVVEDFEDIQNSDDESNLEDGDYGFIIDGDGNLKGILGAIEIFADPPEAVLQILDMFGIDHIDFIKQHTTIH